MQSGQIDPGLQSAAATIPYGSLALAAIGIAWGIAKHVQAGKTLAEGQQVQAAFTQMVKALDVALPQPTELQKAAIAGALDRNARARAAAVRTV